MRFAQMSTSRSTVTFGAVLLLWAHWARAQDANCDYTQNVVPGKVYYVYSPGYSAKYQGGVQCRWIAICPTGYNCRLDCSEISLPQSSSCSVDRLLISRTGDPQLSAAEYYCGTGTLYNVVSTGQRLSIGLITSRNSAGGKFYCELTAQAATSNPTTCSCGYKKVNRIVGGDPTQPNEYTVMAGIVYRELSSIKCGAVIVSTRHVVTAGHCMVTRTLSKTAVIVGEHDVTTGSDSSATQGFMISSFTVHPQYTNTNYQNDIAVVTVQGTITFSEYVGPVCLPFKYTSASFAGAKVELLGWGTTFIGGPTSNVLRKVLVDVISQSQCQSTVTTVTSKQLCTYTPGKDACQDDSGGPVLYTDPATGRLVLVGIISYGRSCASNSPGINTRITAYLDWIVNTAPANYCRI